MCRPIRTFSTPVPAGHCAAIRTRCASTAAPTAPTAEENATAIPSPVVENSTPPWRANAARSAVVVQDQGPGHGSRLGLPQPRGTFDVGEKEGHRSGRQLPLLVPVGDGLATAVLIVASAELALGRWSDVRMAAGWVWGGS